ncbi:thyroid receptor-interacting protein 11-like [Euwallacea similis]|uniref:thyroid receptor-interacting protein 11-like n=1 Tax=Euwallacea similis TaxID=1736056 RepID=UPI00345047BC
MSGWFNINEGLSNIKGQLTTFANNVLADDEGANTTEEQYKKLCYQKDLEIEHLRQVNDELQKSSGVLHKENGKLNKNTWNWTPADLTVAHASPKEDEISNLKQTIKILENDKNDLLSQLEQLDIENQQNLSELVRIREHLQDENNELKEENDLLKKNAAAGGSFKGKYEQVSKELNTLKRDHELLQKSLETSKISSEQRIAHLVEELEKFKISHSELQKNTLVAEEKHKEEGDEKHTLELYEQQINSLKNDLKSSLNEIQELRKEVTDRTQQQFDREFLNKKLEENHNKYISIIAANVKRHIEAAPSEEAPPEDEDNLSVSHFSHQVENIFKILQEFKQKCYTLEQELMAAQNEKTQILNEKYEEIEKLIQNSELLSQEVVTKGETIKELESEISHLIGSNDVLLAEVEQFKNSGLQTISESNEDSMVLLESDLENANRRIKELECIIDSPCKSATLSPDSTKQEDYQQLLVSFDELKIDYDEAQIKLHKIEELEAENDELKGGFERLKTDFENTDYQLSEANFALDGLKDELQEVKEDFGKLLQENKDLKLQTMAMIDLKSEINEVKEKWLNEENLRRELEAQLKILTEKQQNSKMSETSLKLQLDTFNKERQADLDVKANLQQALNDANESLKKYENNYTELLQKYDAVLLRCEELNTQLHDKENELLRTREIEEDNQKFRRTIEEKEAELCQKNDDLRVLEIELTKSLEDKEKLTQVVETGKQTNEKEVGLRVREMEDNETLRRNVQDKAVEVIRLTELIETMKIDMEKMLAKVEEAEVANFKLNELNLIIESQKKLIEANQEDLSLKSSEITALEASLAELEQTIQTQKEEIGRLQSSDALTSNESIQHLQQQLQDLSNSRNELINMVQIKHQESLDYHQEIQRLSNFLTNKTQKITQLEARLLQASLASDEIARKSEEIDRLIDQTSFLKEKCDVLTKNLLEEQAKTSSVSDKEITLSKQLERLQDHIMELEERYTQELLQAEQKNAQLQLKLSDLEAREKNSSTMYTSVSIRANQQVESLQNQLQTIVGQREELRKKISDLEDVNGKQAAALANLQLVLEQFQKDKEKDVHKETERIRRQINAEKLVQDDLKKEIDSLKMQLDESKIGLQAASRLSDQLELIKKQNSGLKDEVTQLQQKLIRTQQTIQELTSQTDGKIDKSLIKSLIVGFLSSGNTNNWNKDQAQVLKLIATVLDFNQQDHDKVKLNKSQQGSWLGSLLTPQPANETHESLSQAFVRFLENESKPREVPSLLGEASKTSTGVSSESSRRTTPRASPSPIVLNEVVLPTFAEFGQSRSSSSILKDVLKDNSNR